MEVILKNIDTEDKNIDNEEPIEEPIETQEPKEEQEKIFISSVDKKKQNKIYKCEYCNKELSKKSYYYSHNCLLKKQANQQKQEPKQEQIKPKEQPKINKQNQEKEQARRNIHGDRMKRLFNMAM